VRFDGRGIGNIVTKYAINHIHSWRLCAGETLLSPECNYRFPSYVTIARSRSLATFPWAMESSYAAPLVVDWTSLTIEAKTSMNRRYDTRSHLLRVPSHLLSIIRRIVSDNIDLSKQYRATDRHRDGDDRKIDSHKVPAAHEDEFVLEDISPQQPSQRRTESDAESAVVDANDHAVDGCPERAVRDGDAVHDVDVLPCLHDSRQKDGGADVCASKLSTWSVRQLLLCSGEANTYVAEDDRDEAHASDSTYSTSLLHPCVPSVSEDGDPSLGD
jgi:hypothetical protein